MANIKDAPKAKQITKELSMHDDVRQDAFYWLNERENPEVIASTISARNLPLCVSSFPRLDRK